MKQTLLWVLTSLVITVIGAAAGWFAAAQNQTDAGEGDDGHGATAAAVEELSSQTLKNLGVTVGKAELSTYTRTLRVQATVMEAPLNFHDLTAPLGGIVTKIHVTPGQIVKAGDAVVSLARAPIARPELTLTADILTSVSENLHQSVAALRDATAQHEIASAEFARIKAIADAAEDGLPVVPKQTLIDRGYDLKRAALAKANAEMELQRHGLSPEEIEDVRQGGRAPGNRRLWQRALREHDLWGATETRIHGALEGDVQTRPWTIAAIGELSAAGMATDALADALKTSKLMRREFVSVAALLLAGHTITHTRLLADSGALEPIVTLRAPDSAPDWDVATLAVRTGQRLEAGAAVAALHDARAMWLRIEPVGNESGVVISAFEAKTTLRAEPLVADTGPMLLDLTIHRLAAQRDDDTGLATIVASNQPVVRDGARSWRLRKGMRYFVHVPIATWNDRFVLPASALTDRGPDRVVYVPDGKTFRAIPVTVEFRDETTAVIAHDGAIFPGDELVRTGAFALGLAMQAGTGAADPHAGHNHD